MDQTVGNNQDSYLSESMIDHLKRKLSKTEKLLLKTLYNTPHLQHKNLAELMDMSPNSLSNLISRIKNIYEDLIIADSMGRNKFYSLSQIAKLFTKSELLPEETTRNNALQSALQTDPLTCNALDLLLKFQEYEGDNWDIVLDDLLFAETREQLAKNIHFRSETIQNYTNFKNAMINLVIQRGKQSVQNVYSVLKQNILIARLDSLISSASSFYYKMEPLFHIEERNVKVAYSIIDKIFLEHSPAPAAFDTNSFDYFNLPSEKYDDIDWVINKMIGDFKKKPNDKTAFIEKWEEKLYTRNQYSSISYIAEKCRTFYYS